MTSEIASNQINREVLLKLSQLYQREATSLIELYIKESSKLIEKLNTHFNPFDFKHVLRILRDLRHSSVEIGASKFSFFLLSLEIAVFEYRLQNPSEAMNLIHFHHETLVDELCKLREDATESREPA